MGYYSTPPTSDEIWHHGINGQKWGIRRYQNSDGSLTAAGKRRYAKGTLHDASEVALATAESMVYDGYVPFGMNPDKFKQKIRAERLYNKRYDSKSAADRTTARTEYTNSHTLKVFNRLRKTASNKDLIELRNSKFGYEYSIDDDLLKRLIDQELEVRRSGGK